MRLFLAGFFLILSSARPSHVDSAALVAWNDRPATPTESTYTPQATIIERGSAPRAQPTRLASLAPVTTGAIAMIDPGLPDGVNRTGKGDLLFAAKTMTMSDGDDDTRAQTAALYAPASLADKNAYQTFAPPIARRETITVDQAPVKAAITALPVPRPARAKAAAPVVLAYAPADTKDDAGNAIEAVIKPKIASRGLLVPNVDRNHAWVNSPIPASARSKTESKCLATAIYFEARGEPERGQLAVAQVVINRLKNPAYPDTVCGVVYQNKNKRNRCQFSFACDGIKDRITDKASWAQAQKLADRVLNDERTVFQTDVSTSTHYHANYVRPRWARHMKKMQKIGRHIFYKTYGGGWS